MAAWVLSFRLTASRARMGSVIQTYGIKGANNDMLSIEKPDIILDIQRRYVDAGVDCLTTNTFSSQRVSQHEYHQEHRIAEMNRAAVKIAKQAAAEAMEKYGRQVYILGDVGPTSKMTNSKTPTWNRFRC